MTKFRLSDGSALLLATGKWLTPSGRVAWHQGIMPDQVVPLPAGAKPVLPQAGRALTAADLQASGDVQLLQALDLLVQYSSVKRWEPRWKVPHPSFPIANTPGNGLP